MFGLQRWQVENTVKLIDEGNTIPFIARYRKEAHGTLDDQVLRELSEKLEYLRNLDKRREEISASITAQEKMTPEIEAALEKVTGALLFKSGMISFFGFVILPPSFM